MADSFDSEKQQYCLAKAECESQIQLLESEIQSLESKLSKQKAILKTVEKKLVYCDEDEFTKMYDVSPDKVRKDYIAFVLKHCHSCGEGHDVTIGGKQIIPPNASHTLLLPRYYKICQPSGLQIEAFKIIGQDIWIEPTPHIERWGN
jgi:hypothetical protein